MTSENRFEPEIVAFCCHHCAYAATDLARIMGLQYPPNIKLIKLPCSGTIDILHVLKAFEQGTDGVFVAGCVKDDCHFKEGNIHAERRVERVKAILDKIGLGKDRLEMFFMSASEGPRFAEVAREMTERIRELGPSPVKGV